MEFSSALQEKGPHAWSPDGSMLATCDANRLYVRDTSTLIVISIYSNADAVDCVEWSPDGKFILCAMYKRAIVQVWSVDDPEWFCKISEGRAGLAHSRWGPHERHILNTNEFNVRVSVWDLSQTAGVVASLSAPKFADKGMSFSRDKRFLAVAERKDCQDAVQIYRCDSWEPVKRFAVATRDLADLCWAPSEDVIAVWDSSLEYLVLVYSPDGRLIERYSAYEGALGIKSVAFSPSSQFLALGSFDGAARLLNALTWRPIQNFHLPASASPAAGLVYVERDLSGVVQAPVADEHAAHAVARSSYELLDADAPAVRVEVTKAEVKVNPRMGVGLLAWAPDSSLLATRSDEAPNVLWVWSASTLALSAALVQLAPIKDAKWSPVEPRLALCGGGRNVYLWTPDGASCIEVPLPNLCVHTLDWAPDGRALILRDHDAHSVAFVTA